MLPIHVLPHRVDSEDEDQMREQESETAIGAFGFKKHMSEDDRRAHKLDRRVRRHAGYIYRQAEDDDRTIYFIREGVIELFQENDPGRSIMLGNGDGFGQMCLSWLKEPSEQLRTHSARAVTETSLYMLNRSALLDLEVSLALNKWHLSRFSLQSYGSLRALSCFAKTA